MDTIDEVSEDNETCDEIEFKVKLDDEEQGKNNLNDFILYEFNFKMQI